MGYAAEQKIGAVRFVTGGDVLPEGRAGVRRFPRGSEAVAPPV